MITHSEDAFEKRWDAMPELLSAELYEHLHGLLGEDFRPTLAYPAIDGAFAEGWKDPKMDDYDRYEAC